MSESLTMNAHPEGVLHIECKLDGDPRLIAGAAIIVVHVARRAGMADQDASEIGDATNEACNAMLQTLQAAGSSRAILLAADDLANRIEVTVEPVPNGSGAHPLSSDESRHLADRIRQIAKSSADGSNVELHDGSPRITLLKNCGAAKRPFAI